MRQWKAHPWHRAYWRRVWAEFKAAKWYLVATVFLFYEWQDTIANNGYLKLTAPGTYYVVYYFGFPPGVWGFVLGVFFTLLVKRAREAGQEYEDLNWHDFHKGVIVKAEPPAEQRYPFKPEGEN